MSLRQEISSAQTEALKAKDEKKLSILRMLWSAIRNLEIDKKTELGDEEIQTVVVSQVKQLNDALKDFEKGARVDLTNKAKYEIGVLQKYLPTQLSDEELKNIVLKIIAVAPVKEIGRIMGSVMKEVKGQADGNRVKNTVTQLLSA